MSLNKYTSLWSVWTFIVCSAENDYSEQRRAREEKIEQLSEAVEALRAQQQTTQHDMEQFQMAADHAQEQANTIKK